MPIFIELETERLWVVDRRGEELNTSHVFFLKPINLYSCCISSTAILLTLYCPLTPPLQPLTPSLPLCLPVSVHSYPLPSSLQAFHTDLNLPSPPYCKTGLDKGLWCCWTPGPCQLDPRGEKIWLATRATQGKYLPKCIAHVPIFLSCFFVLYSPLFLVTGSFWQVYKQPGST